MALTSVKKTKNQEGWLRIRLNFCMDDANKRFWAGIVFVWHVLMRGELRIDTCIDLLCVRSAPSPLSTNFHLDTLFYEFGVKKLEFCFFVDISARSSQKTIFEPLRLVGLLAFCYFILLPDSRAFLEGGVETSLRGRCGARSITSFQC